MKFRPRGGCSLLIPLLSPAIRLVLGASLHAQDTPSYRDPKLPVEPQVADLHSCMTPEGKVAQLESAWENREFFPEERVSFVEEKGAVLLVAAVQFKYGLGEMGNPGQHRGPREMAEFTNTLQKLVEGNTRLGIPILFHEECLHGLVAPGGTSYPAAIALASTWEPGLVHEVFTATSAEVRSRGAQQCLSPVPDLARDPRWGRTEETYGEDPYPSLVRGVN